MRPGIASYFGAEIGHPPGMVDVVVEADDVLVHDLVAGATISSIEIAPFGYLNSQ